MFRISRLCSQVSPEVRESYDVFMKQRGNIPNVFRTVAHRPEYLRTMIAHFRAIMDDRNSPNQIERTALRARHQGRAQLG